MTTYNTLKLNEVRNDLKNAEREILRVAVEDDSSHTLMFALNNLKAAIMDLDRSINTTKVEFVDLPEHLKIIKKTLGL